MFLLLPESLWAQRIMVLGLQSPASETFAVLQHRRVLLWGYLVAVKFCLYFLWLSHSALLPDRPSKFRVTNMFSVFGSFYGLEGKKKSFCWFPVSSFERAARFLCLVRFVWDTSPERGNTCCTEGLWSPECRLNSSGEFKKQSHSLVGGTRAGSERLPQGGPLLSGSHSPSLLQPEEGGQNPHTPKNTQKHRRLKGNHSNWERDWREPFPFSDSSPLANWLSHTWICILPPFQLVQYELKTILLTNMSKVEGPGLTGMTTPVTEIPLKSKLRSDSGLCCKNR